jgi:signal transduction histidine kinase
MGVSHDLRTPLALIKGYTEAIADDVADSPEMRQKSLEIIGDKIDSLQEMIDDLINYVKLDSGEWRGSLELREIKPALVNYVNRLSVDARLLNRKTESYIDLPDTLPGGKPLLVQFDERLFVRALENLCGNALRYTDAGGTVKIEAKIAAAGQETGGKNPAPLPPAPYIVITVSDNGCGIAEEDLPFIFDPFYRGSNSRREEGKGLGLAVVKNIIDSHGWKIEVESKKDEGSSFRMIIGIA